MMRPTSTTPNRPQRRGRFHNIPSPRTPDFDNFSDDTTTDDDGDDHDRSTDIATDDDDEDDETHSEGRASSAHYFPFSQRDTSHYSDNSYSLPQTPQSHSTLGTPSPGRRRRRRKRSENHHHKYPKTWQAWCGRWIVLPLHQTLQLASHQAAPPWHTASHYEDVYNDESWSCSAGTSEHDGVWLNFRDRAGTLMSVLVWLLIFYSLYTILLLTSHGHIPQLLACVYCTLGVLMLACHVKTALTDPGGIPLAAVPLPSAMGAKFHSMCSQCQSYKPAKCHHCRICNRCIAGMDHHCPWMNNCVGAANMKHFILFLVYTWTSCALVLLLFTVNYFFCNTASAEHNNDDNNNSAECHFTAVEMVLVRTMTCIAIGTLLFTSSMLMNVIYNLLTGTSTIDRLKMKAADTWHEAVDEEVPLTDIFGIGPRWTWCLPVDPVFDDYDRIMGYATRTRLLRYKEQQQQLAQHAAESSVDGV